MPHDLLSFQSSFFCKWPVINVTQLTFKIVVHKYKTDVIYFNSISETI